MCCSLTGVWLFFICCPLQGGSNRRPTNEPVNPKTCRFELNPKKLFLDLGAGRPIGIISWDGMKLQGRIINEPICVGGGFDHVPRPRRRGGGGGGNGSEKARAAQMTSSSNFQGRSSKPAGDESCPPAQASKRQKGRAAVGRGWMTSRASGNHPPCSSCGTG